MQDSSIVDDERRRDATRISPAPQAKNRRGCGGRPPTPALLLLGVSGLLIRLRRRALDSAVWRAQRRPREVSG